MVDGYVVDMVCFFVMMSVINVVLIIWVGEGDLILVGGMEFMF